ncbi:MAG TPA: hypothetical protein VII62_09925 [Vicinamibacteria bacterium]|jgi:hypothetical protein
MPDVDPPPILAPPPARAITIRRQKFGFVVSPGTFRVDTEVGETPHVKVRNRAGLDALVTFPDGVMLDEQNNPITTFTIPHDAQRRLKVDIANAPGFFEYRVEIVAAGIEAQGNSRPGVEIVR